MGCDFFAPQANKTLNPFSILPAAPASQDVLIAKDRAMF